MSNSPRILVRRTRSANLLHTRCILTLRLCRRGQELGGVMITGCTNPGGKAAGKMTRSSSLQAGNS